MKWHRKDIVIDAVQWFPGVHVEHVQEIVHDPGDGSTISNNYGVINTNYIPLHVDSGDWVITGSLGEIYVLTDHQFKQTFSPDTGELVLEDKFNEFRGFDEYQKAALGTAIYPTIGNNIVYPTLGLVGESGEIAEKVKKLFRDSNGVITEDFIQQMKKESGDVLWYLAALAFELGISLSEVAAHNIAKLRDRQRRNVLGGSGDNR